MSNDIDFDRIIGTRIDLDEWKSILDKRKADYIEIHDVKTLNIPNLKINKKNIPILLMMKSSGWSPKNGSSWGSSGADGEGGYDIEGYGLTNDEIRELIGHLLDESIEFRTTDKNMRQWHGNKEIIPPRCQNIISKNNCDKEKGKKIDVILREAAEEKFKSKDTIKKHFITINKCIFEYASEVIERIGHANSGLTFALYIYDKDGKYKESYNCPGIWG